MMTRLHVRVPRIRKCNVEHNIATRNVACLMNYGIHSENGGLAYAIRLEHKNASATRCSSSTLSPQNETTNEKHASALIYAWTQKPFFNQDRAVNPNYDAHVQL